MLDNNTRYHTSTLDVKGCCALYRIMVYLTIILYSTVLDYPIAFPIPATVPCTSRQRSKAESNEANKQPSIIFVNMLINIIPKVISLSKTVYTKYEHAFF